MSNSTPAESTYVTATQALMELVRLKDVHDRVEEMGKFGCPDDKAEEFHALVKDYADNKAKAWAAAREVLRSRGLSYQEHVTAMAPGRKQAWKERTEAALASKSTLIPEGLSRGATRELIAKTGSEYFPDCPVCGDNIKVYRGLDGKLRCGPCHDNA